MAKNTVKINSGLLLVLAIVSSIVLGRAETDARHAVNTFVGTDGGGNTFPGATLPLGMMQWSPDTRDDGWYRYSDQSIRGFSLTHISGAGCPIYADVPILPWIGSPSANPNSATLRFSHHNEHAEPGYYSVKFDNGVKSELTVTERAGIGRFSFPPGSVRTVLFKAGSSATANDPRRNGDRSEIHIREDDTLVGTVHSGGFCFVPGDYVLHFAARFSQPFSSFGTWSGDVEPGSRTVGGHGVGGYVSFSSGRAPIVLKVAVSFVSVENAIANLNADIPGWDFDQTRSRAAAIWSRALHRIELQGGTSEDRVKFYTGLYHMLLSPNLFSDVNDEYMGFDGRLHQLHAGEAQYTNISDWDIYRNLVQLQALLMPEQTGQIMQSLVRDAEQSGWLPKWPLANDVTYIMGGDSPPILISDAWAFGARGFDTNAALMYMIKGATEPGQGPHGGSERPWLNEYETMGYVPVDGNGQEIGASVTLEYANSDFAISRFAAAEGDDVHADSLLNSAQNWKNLFDTETGFIRPRDTSGRFVEGWDPVRLLPKPQHRPANEQLGFEEGNTWHYTFMIPFNYQGLLQAIGSNDSAVRKLDKFFESIGGLNGSHFTVENEPDFCTPFVYMWMGYPWKTQKVIDRIRRKAFSASPNGLPGNDDLGATSGVFVWNALGMYPVIPGVGGVVLGTPLFPRAELRLGNGSVLKIRSSGRGIYVESVSLNGEMLKSAWLPLERLKSSQNKIDFVLGEQPGSWATQVDSFPPSFDDQGN